MYFYKCGFSLKFCLTLINLTMYISGLTVDYREYIQVDCLTFIVTAVTTWSTDNSGVPPPYWTNTKAIVLTLLIC